MRARILSTPRSFRTQNFSTLCLMTSYSVYNILNRNRHYLRSLSFRWDERWTLFWTSPIVLFLTNQLWSTIVTILFTFWFIDLRLSHATPTRIFYGESDVSLEYSLLMFFCTSLFKEFMACAFSCVRDGMRRGMWIQFYDLVCYDLFPF